MGRLIRLIFVKEMLETLRDRRTLVVMVLLPLVLYPVVVLVLGQGMLSFEAAEREVSSRVGFAGDAWPELRRAVLAHPEVRDAGRGTAAKVKAGEIDLVVDVPAGARAQALSSGSVKVALVHDQTRDRSSRALSRVRPQVKVVARVLADTRMFSRGLPPTFSRPLATADRDTASSEELGAHLLARVLPVLAVLMVLLGAFYPAIDLTAGEKERGTLETLLAAPVPRTILITAKFLAVFVVATVTGLLNLASMGLTFTLALHTGIGEQAVAIAVPWSSLAMTVLAILPSALFFSAVMVAVASLARSFKEAQNLLTPVYIALMFPAFAAMLPGIELTVFTALLPALNVALLSRELIAGKLSPLPVLLCLGASALYTAVALRFAASIYRSERMLFAPRRTIGGPNSAVLPRRPTPEPREAAALLLLVMGLLILVGQQVQARNLVVGLLVTEWLLIAAPVLLLLRLGRIDPRVTLSLTRAPPLAFVGAALAGLSGWFLVAVLVEGVQQRFLPIPQELVDEMQRLLVSQNRPVVFDLAVLALSPAICEELLFRGVLLRASLRVLTPTTAMLLNGVLFGVFHLSIYRFFPTFFLGIVLAFIVLRTRSIWPAMLFHFLNNASALLSSRLVDGADQQQQLAVALPLVGLAAAVFVCGMLVLARSTRGPRFGDSAKLIQ